MYDVVPTLFRRLFEVAFTSLIDVDNLMSILFAFFDVHSTSVDNVVSTLNRRRFAHWARSRIKINKKILFSEIDFKP